MKQFSTTTLRWSRGWACDFFSEYQAPINTRCFTVSPFTMIMEELEIHRLSKDVSRWVWGCREHAHGLPAPILSHIISSSTQNKPFGHLYQICRASLPTGLVIFSNTFPRPLATKYFKRIVSFVNLAKASSYTAKSLAWKTGGSSRRRPRIIVHFNFEFSLSKHPPRISSLNCTY